MKKIILLLSVLVLIGCNKHTAKSVGSVDGFDIKCLNGVKYYMTYIGYTGYFAPVFNKDTKQVELCNY